MSVAPKRPAPGDVYTFPAEGRGHVVCRVVGRAGAVPFGRSTLEAFEIELALWPVHSRPNLDEALAAEVHVLTYYREIGGSPRPARFRASGYLPEAFELIGRQVKPPIVNPAEFLRDLDWAFLGDEMSIEAEYRAHPAGFREAFRARMRDMERRARELTRRLSSQLKSSKAEKSLGTVLSWQPGVSQDAVAAGNGAIETFRKDLRRARTTRAKSKAVRECVESFNRLDETFGGIIDTVVAGEIVDLIVEAGTAVGLEEVDRLVEDTRMF